MGRRALPARKKCTYRDGTFLYGWRPQPGAKELTGKGPGGVSNLELFKAHVLLCWNAGVEPTPPGTFLAPASPTAAPDVTAPTSTAPTLRDWIGDPAKGVRGDFFLHGETMKKPNEDQYERTFRLHGAFELIGDIPMDQVTVNDANNVCNRVLRCQACVALASQLRPLQEISDFDLRADRPTFNKKPCVLHRPARLKQRASVDRYFSTINAAFNAAVRAKVITENPFTNISYGYWEEPEINDDLRVSLSHSQLDLLTRAHPDELQVVPAVSTDGMLRRSEMWGLWTKDFPVPPEDPSDDPETVTFQLSRVWNTSTKSFVPWGKTAKSLSESIVLGAATVKTLNNHLRHHMSPSPECDACTRGERVWRGVRRNNPHSRCGYANDAPLVPYSVCTPDHYSKSVCPQSQLAAGLGDIGFKITHRAYRSTGAVLHLDAGVRATTVLKMGRWTDLDTLMKHYNRPSLDQFTDAAKLVDRTRAAELGIDQTDSAPVSGRLRFLSDQNAALSSRCEALELENAQLRAREELPERLAPGPIVQVRRSNRRVGKWDALHDDDLRSAIQTERSQLKILVALGLSTAHKNYTRLRAEALRLGMELPPSWATTPDVAVS